MLNRREFVSALVSLGFVGAASWTASAAQSSRIGQNVSLSGPLRKALFFPLVGETFTVWTGKQNVAITLTEIHEVPSSFKSEQFTLLFKGPQGVTVPDGIYTVSHRRAGRAKLFLQPGCHDDRNCFCQASFNLL